MRGRMVRTMQAYTMAAQGGTVLAAVSGGRDSMALLHALKALEDEMGFVLRAVHIHHGLRADADGDQLLVQRYAAQLGVPLETVRLCVREGRKKGESVEMAARRLRYGAFARALEGHAPGTVLATAHHRRDQAETVLMRLIRGAGTRGLAGIHPVRGAFIRPMLFVSDQEIERYVQQNDIPYREDASNKDVRILRNRIRHELLPLLKKQYNPNLERALAATAMAAREDEMFLRALVDGQKQALGWQSVPQLAVWMQTQAFLALAPPLQKRALRMAMEQLGQYRLQQRTLSAVLRAAKSGGAAQISATAYVRSGRFLQIYRAAPPSEEVLPLFPGQRRRLGSFWVQCRAGQAGDETNGEWTALVDAGALAQGLFVRTRREGDALLLRVRA